MHTLFYLVLSYCFFHKKSSGARFFKRAPTISDKTFHYFPASVFSRPFAPCRRPENYKIFFCGRHSFFRRGRQKASYPKMLPAILHESQSEQHDFLLFACCSVRTLNRRHWHTIFSEPQIPRAPNKFPLLKNAPLRKYPKDNVRPSP